jgi:hypothetical protein
MRFMVTFQIPKEEGNALIKDGRIGPAMETILDDLKPEAAYFAEIEGYEADTSSSTWTTVPKSPLSRNPSSWEWVLPFKYLPCSPPTRCQWKRCSKRHRSTARARYYTHVEQEPIAASEAIGSLFML